MKVLVAGATGALGLPTVKELLSRGHEVYGLTRSKKKAEVISSLGAEPVVGDVLDPGSLENALVRARPEGVLQLLNALPKRGPLRASELKATNELRVKGTANLVPAAARHGVRRYVVESMIFGYAAAAGRAAAPVDETAPFGERMGVAEIDEGLAALDAMERTVLEASARGEIEGVVLRLGVFYGPKVGSTIFMTSLLRKRMMFIPGGGRGSISWIHVDDGATACVEALERAPAGSIYNVVDDEPAGYGDMAQTLADALGVKGPRSMPMGLARRLNGYAAGMATARLQASNARIKAELGWKPRYSTIREGAASVIAGGPDPRR